MANNLVAFRKSLGLSQKDFAASLGIGQTTYNGYEKGNREPRSDFWVKVAKMYNVSVDYLMGYTDQPNGSRNNTNKNSAPFLSNEALEVANLYELASTDVKAAVRAVLSIGGVRSAPIVVSKPKKIIPIFNTAAGSGDPESDIGWETYETENLKADFAIHVVGNSMEPLLPDGSVALGVRRMPRDGEVAAFRLDGEFLVKQVCQDSEGNVYLFSVNRNRSDADQTIWRSSGRDLWCFGTILCDRVPLPD